MDGARFLGAAGAGAAQVEDEDLVARAVHARDRAARKRMARRSRRYAPFAVGRSRPVHARRWSIARAPSRVKASRNASSSMARRRCGGFRSASRAGRGTALLRERRQRSLPEGDFLDAAPAKMSVDPRNDHRGAVLRFQRERAVHSEHQSCGGGGASGSRFAPRGGHCSSIGRAKARDRLADDRGPVGDQACFAQAPRGQRLPIIAGMNAANGLARERARFIMASARKVTMAG